MNRKLNESDIPKIKELFEEDNKKVKDVSLFFQFSHPSAFVKGLRSIGYTISRTIIKNIV
jgi:AraC-like DNA-binding protein